MNMGTGLFDVAWDFGDGSMEVDRRPFERDLAVGGFTLWSTRVHTYVAPGNFRGTVDGVNAGGGFGRLLE